MFTTVIFLFVACWVFVGQRCMWGWTESGLGSVRCQLRQAQNQNPRTHRLFLSTVYAHTFDIYQRERERGVVWCRCPLLWNRALFCLSFEPDQTRTSSKRQPSVLRRVVVTITTTVFKRSQESVGGTYYIQLPEKLGTRVKEHKIVISGTRSYNLLTTYFIKKKFTKL